MRDQRIIVIYTQIPGVQGTNHGVAFVRAGTENATPVTDVTDLLPAAGQLPVPVGDHQIVLDSVPVGFFLWTAPGAG